MGFFEILVYIILIVSSCRIAIEIAKNGLLEIGIQRPPNTKAWNATFIGVITMVIAGFVSRSGHLQLSLLSNENIVRSILIFTGIPLLVLIVARYVFLPKGLPQYNRAKNRMNYWMLSYFRSGVKLDIGNNLANFPQAQKALDLFKKSIEIQRQGSMGGPITRTVPIEPGRAEYDNTNYVACPNCGISIKVPLGYYGDGQGTGTCNICGCYLAFKVLNGEIHLTAYGPKVRIITSQHHHNIATAYLEMALLLRMMNRFDDSKEALADSLEIINKLLEKDESNKEYLSTKSLAIFRQGEIAHATGIKSEAKRLYEESLDIDNKIDKHQDDELIKRLISEVS